MHETHPLILDCFLLTRQWRDTPQGIELVFWAHSAQGPVRIVISGQTAIFFIEHEAPLAGSYPAQRTTLDLQTLHGRPVDGLYFQRQREQQTAAAELKHQGVAVYESDIRPTERYLMERFITAGFKLAGTAQQHQGYLEFRNPRLAPAEYQPRFSSLSLDIETDDMDGALYSIAGIFRDAGGGLHQRLFYHSPQAVSALGKLAAPVSTFTDEATLLGAFFGWVKECDPDLLLGWNVVNFDLSYLERRCKRLGLPFDLGRGREHSTIMQPQSPQQVAIARLPGRVVLDGIDTLRSATWSFESYSLDYVAQSLLGRGKLISAEEDKVAEVRRLYRDDPTALLAYNLEDAQLVLDIADHTHLIRFAIERARLTGLAMDRIGGSVAAFDNLYLPRLHRKGYVAADIGDFDELIASPGGYVMDSQPGLYENVLVLDFKSLYPSIIRTFRIDPLGLAQPGADPVQGFSGGSFSRADSLLPDIIAQLWAARDEAKLKKDEALSRAIKIIMNSFYGVLGTPGCRFFNPKLASSITRRGHEIIHRSRDFIEACGLPVIYGDTDSLFVLLGADKDVEACQAIGTKLALELNNWWRETLQAEHRLESFLEIQFETHYLKFLMPTIRGSDKGSKKRYAGLVQGRQGYRLVFKGLESVRTDWTPLAREFQRELYRRVFLDEPYAEFIRATADRLMQGELDAQLYYRKRLRRNLGDYVKNVPPHVQAARKLEEAGKKVGGWVEYLITVNGPEPKGLVHSAIDYPHYLERQLKPAAEGILGFLEQGFDGLYEKQIPMF